MNLNLREIFEKPIDRPIDGVIKADDEESILDELEEYVIISVNFLKTSIPSKDDCSTCLLGELRCF